MPAKPAAPRSADLAYKARYCAEVTAFMGLGYSLTAFAGEIGASRALLQTWCEKYAPFARAVACGQAKRARKLEDNLLAGKGAAAFGVHMQALRTAAPEEWPEPGAKAAPSGRPKATPQAAVALPDNGRE